MERLFTLLSMTTPNLIDFHEKADVQASIEGDLIYRSDTILRIISHRDDRKGERSEHGLQITPHHTTAHMPLQCTSHSIRLDDLPCSVLLAVRMHYVRVCTTPMTTNVLCVDMCVRVWSLLHSAYSP